MTFKRLLAAYRWFMIGVAIVVMPFLCYVVERLYQAWQELG